MTTAATDNPYAAPANKDFGGHPTVPDNVEYLIVGNVVYTHHELNIGRFCFWTGTQDVGTRPNRRIIVDLSLIDRLSIWLIVWSLIILVLAFVQPYAANTLVLGTLSIGVVVWLFAWIRGPKVTVQYGLSPDVGVKVSTTKIAVGLLTLLFGGIAIQQSSLRFGARWDLLLRADLVSVFFSSLWIWSLVRSRIKPILSASRVAENTFRIQGLPRPLLNALQLSQNHEPSRSSD